MNRTRRLPVGAESVDRDTHFRVWAPQSQAVAVEIYAEDGRTVSRRAPLAAEGAGYFGGLVPDVPVGTRYRLLLDQGAFPDPASRYQPEGPHGPSAVVSPEFRWTDGAWKGRAPRELVLYELHLGTFTPEGDWRAAEAQLPELARIGITGLEIMPIAEMPGRFGWGYDGVNLFAPSRIYGTPDDVRRFVNRAHELGIAVILDVVYNHLGPDGNYLTQFAKEYFAARASEWGDAINFDGPGSGPVREYYAANAGYWIDEFHFDGLRLDATHQIFDTSQPHIIAEIAAAARAAAPHRQVYLVGENESQHSRLVRPVARGGCGLDALWNDDFHHSAMVAATGRAECYFLDYRGSAQEFISAAKYGFLYQGSWYAWQKQRRGTPALDLLPHNFVIFLQNHDQLANTLRGERLHQQTSAGRFRALTALSLLQPCTPLLFQGQEFAASTPFLYFADHHAELSALVREGRRKFLQQFRTIASGATADRIDDPGSEETFRRCKLDLNERERHAGVYQLHIDLLRLRREDPTVSEPAGLDGAVLSDEAFVLRYFSTRGEDRLLLVNLGRELYLQPSPEPLLAPLEDRGWRVLWSSEDPVYGGVGTPDLETTANWILPGHAAVLMEPAANATLPHARLAEKN